MLLSISSEESSDGREARRHLLPGLTFLCCLLTHNELLARHNGKDAYKPTHCPCDSVSGEGIHQAGSARQCEGPTFSALYSHKAPGTGLLIKGKTIPFLRKECPLVVLLGQPADLEWDSVREFACALD